MIDPTLPAMTGAERRHYRAWQRMVSRDEALQILGEKGACDWLRANPTGMGDM